MSAVGGPWKEVGVADLPKVLTEARRWGEVPEKGGGRRGQTESGEGVAEGRGQGWRRPRRRCAFTPGQ